MVTELFLKFKMSASAEDIKARKQEISAINGVDKLEELFPGDEPIDESDLIFALDLKNGADPEAIAKKIESLPEVDYVYQPYEKGPF